jgi:acetyl-CoA C-acetyltransferase
LYVGNMLSGVLAQQQQLGGLIADYSGLAGIEAVTIEAACASGGAAVRVAYQAVAGGIHDVVAACGVERMTHVDRDAVTRALATAADWELEGVCGESFLSLNATLMRAYMDKYGVAAERFAPFAITAHRNALTNPNALLHKALDLETYLESRIVTDPIRLFDVSPVCNGASAVILAAPSVAAEMSNGARVRIAGSALATAPLALKRRSDPLDLTAVTSSTHQALKQAGIGRDDVDLFEPHDAYTIMTALTLEAAGFARPGAGLDYADAERIGLRGELPLATFGGLKARGHPVGASGCYQVVEAFLQLAHRAGGNQVPDAGVALVQNIGGTGATVVSHVLTRED